MGANARPPSGGLELKGCALGGTPPTLNTPHLTPPLTDAAPIPLPPSKHNAFWPPPQSRPTLIPTDPCVHRKLGRNNSARRNQVMVLALNSAHLGQKKLLSKQSMLLELSAVCKATVRRKLDGGIHAVWLTLAVAHNARLKHEAGGTTARVCRMFVTVCRGWQGTSGNQSPAQDTTENQNPSQETQGRQNPAQDTRGSQNPGQVTPEGQSPT